MMAALPPEATCYEMRAYVEATHIANLGCEGDGNNQVYAAQCLKSSNNRRKRPGRQELLYCRFNPFDPFCGHPNSINEFLQSDLVRRMIEVLLLKPAEVAHAPRNLARINPPMLQHETTDLLAVHALSFDCRSARANQIAHRFMALVWDPYWRKFSRAKQLCQTHRVSPVGLYPVARLSGDQ
jgi:hypothetical protein